MANYKVPRAVEIVDELPLQRDREGDEGRPAGAGGGARSGARRVTRPEPGDCRRSADLRVVELGVWVAAPAASALLADWGADVIKVEPPSG